MLNDGLPGRPGFVYRVALEVDEAGSITRHVIAPSKLNQNN
jgi:hypothetical protein